MPISTTPSENETSDPKQATTQPIPISRNRIDAWIFPLLVIIYPIALFDRNTKTNSFNKLANFGE